MDLVVHFGEASICCARSGPGCGWHLFGAYVYCGKPAGGGGWGPTASWLGKALQSRTYRRSWRRPLARVRGATEEMPPLDELAALQEAMAGLAQMGAVLQSLRRTSREDAGAEEKPADEHDC